MSAEFESKLNEFYMERVGKGDALMTAERGKSESGGIK